MSTSNLSHTAPLVAVPSLPSMHAWVSGALHRVTALLKDVLGIHEPSEQTYHSTPFLVKPLLFSGKSIYTPYQDWDGYR